MESSTRHNFTRGILSFVLFFCVLCSIRVLLAMHTYKGISSETPCSWRGVVLSQPSVTGKAVRLDVLVVYVGEKRVSPFKTKVVLYRSSILDDTLPIRSGSGIACVSRFQGLYSSKVKPSYRRYLMSQGFKSQTFATYQKVSLVSL